MSSSIVSMVALFLAAAAFWLSLDVRRQLRELRGQLSRAWRLEHLHDAPSRSAVRRIGMESEADVLIETETSHASDAGKPDVAASAVKEFPRPISWEERLGSQLPIWIGAIALMLAGVFMVRYFAQKGLLGPQTRMILVATFGVLMIGAAQWLRRRQERIGQALAAAGVGVLYATLLGSVNLHQLISPSFGIIGMVAVTAVAVTLSLQHGQLVALCGLAGGFLMPALLRSEGMTASMLFGYLFLLQATFAWYGQRQRWNVLPLLTLLACFVWLASWMLFRFDATEGPQLGLFLLATIAVAVLLSCNADEQRAQWWSMSRLHSILAMAIGLPMTGWLVATSDFAIIHWVYLGILGAGCIVLARLRPDYINFAAFALAAPLMFLLAWGIAGSPAHPRFTGICVGMGSLWGIGSFVAGIGARRKSVWMAMSGISSAACLLLCFRYAASDVTSIPWWVISAGLAAVYFVAAIPVGRCIASHDEDTTEERQPLAIVLMTALGFATFAIPLELERQWITVGWALMLPGIAFLRERLRVPMLRYAIGVLAMLVTLRLLNPQVLTYPTGEHLIFNWLLYGYGIPIAALIAIVRLLHDDLGSVLRSMLHVAAVGLCFVMVTLLVRHGFYPAEFASRSLPQLMEFATYSISWSVFGIALLAQFSIEERLLRNAGVVAAMAGLAAAVIGCGLIANPLWTHVSVGKMTVFNDLIFAFALPAALAGVAARLTHRAGCTATITMWLSTAALLLTFAFVSLEVRQGFQGKFLDGADPRNAEWYSYSAAWLLLAAALLGIGLGTKNAVFRWGSLVIMLAAIGKVFLVDASHLQDLWRVVSFLGLGISLLVVAWIYQHFVFGKARSTNEP